MKRFVLLWAWICLSCFVMVSCQKIDVSDMEVEEVGQDGVTVQFNVTQLEKVPFSPPLASRGTDVKAACKRMSLAVYRAGKKVKQVNQESSDATFGQFKLSLMPGTYKIVVIAHNGLKNPTMTNMEKITFDGKVTDTFYGCEEITVQEGAAYSIALKRAVAMVRLLITDEIPSNVSKMYFYYTGGSSTFDAVHGVGCVNSRQSETLELMPEMRETPTCLEVYTFPRANNNVLQMTVRAMDNKNNTVVEKELENVDVQRNMITQYTINFFGGTSGGGNLHSSTISIDLYSADEWRCVEKVF